MDVRKETFGHSELIGRGFFDEAVQKVLRKRRIVSSHGMVNKVGRQFHLAWPLMVFGWINNLQIFCECNPHETRISEGVGIYALNCYRVDPIFTAELLLAVSSYAKANPSSPLNTPEKITLKQALMEYEDLEGKSGRHEFYSNGILSEKEMAGASPATTPVLPGDLADWKTVAARMVENHPHLKNVVKANSLKAYFHKEKKHREKIHDLWSANFNAYWGLPPYARDNTDHVNLFEKFPEGPNLSLYEKSSVISNHAF